MNEEHKKRGIMHSKFFTAVAISALLLGSSNVMATQTAESSIWKKEPPMVVLLILMANSH